MELDRVRFPPTRGLREPLPSISYELTQLEVRRTDLLRSFASAANSSHRGGLMFKEHGTKIIGGVATVLGSVLVTMTPEQISSLLGVHGPAAALIISGV